MQMVRMPDKILTMDLPFNPASISISVKVLKLSWLQSNGLMWKCKQKAKNSLKADL